MLPGVSVQCPYCGESIELLVDDSAGAQRYVEDCPVCCRPLVVAVAVDAAGQASVRADREDEVGGSG